MSNELGSSFQPHVRSGLSLTVLACLVAPAWTGEKPARPVQVKIEEEKAVVVEAQLPVDPVQRIRFQPNGNFFIQINEQTGRTLHLSHFPTFKVDESVTNPGMGGLVRATNTPLPKTPAGKPRVGYMNVMRHGDVEITQWLELTPTKSPGPGMKRQMDAVLIKYIIENKGTKPHKVGVRTYMDTYIISNDGCLFAAPNRPGKVLNGVEFKGKDVPDFVQLMERPDLKNPGYVAHLTFALGGAADRPDRVILTRHGAARNNWDVDVAPSMGDSGLAFFFDPREIKPGGKRKVMYTYGKGIGSPLSAEGMFKFELGGSFEVGKTFTVSALIADPAVGQSLELELPKGLERIEGKQVQPVPQSLGESGYSMILWKCRVREYGRFPVRLRSSTGVTQTKVVTLSPG